MLNSDKSFPDSIMVYEDGTIAVILSGEYKANYFKEIEMAVKKKSATETMPVKEVFVSRDGIVPMRVPRIIPAFTEYQLWASFHEDSEWEMIDSCGTRKYLEEAVCDMEDVDFYCIVKVEFPEIKS